MYKNLIFFIFSLWIGACSWPNFTPETFREKKLSKVIEVPENQKTSFERGAKMAIKCFDEMEGSGQVFWTKYKVTLDEAEKVKTIKIVANNEKYTTYVGIADFKPLTSDKTEVKIYYNNDTMVSVYKKWLIEKSELCPEKGNWMFR